MNNTARRRDRLEALSWSKGRLGCVGGVSRAWPLAILLMLGVSDWSVATAAPPTRKPNVLFIAIDDLRNDLGVLGAAHAKTPHLDALAATSRVFSHHYVQVPTCGASRRALLSGRYPDQRIHVS